VSSENRLPSSQRADARPLACCGSLLLILLNVGCGGTEGPVRIPVSGKVMFDSAPLSAGVIRFIPTDEKSGPGAATQIINGEFTFTAEDGPVIGSHRVEIEATEHQGFEIDDEAAFAAHVKQTGKSVLAVNPVPVIYNSQSTLTATVTEADAQAISFELNSKP
jgi:hypothetical protein